MECPNCFAETRTESNFCFNCGVPISSSYVSGTTPRTVFQIGAPTSKFGLDEFNLPFDSRYPTYKLNGLLPTDGRPISELYEVDVSGFFQQVCESVGQGVAIAKINGPMVYVNPAFSRILDIPNGTDLSGFTFWDLLAPEMKGPLTTSIIPEIHAKGSWTGELVVKSLEGRQTPTLCNVSLVVSPDGIPLAYAAISIDIREQKRNEQSLKESEERHRLSLWASKQGFYDVNLESGQIYVNTEYTSMLGFDHETFIESNRFFLERVHPDDLERVQTTYAQFLAEELPEFCVEFRQRRADGTWIWTLTHGRVVNRDSSGRPLRIVGTLTDIQDRKAMEIFLRQNESRLIEAQQIGGIGDWEYEQGSSRIEFSEESRQLFGFPPGQRSCSFSDFLLKVHRDDRTEVHDAFRNSCIHPSRYELTHRILLDDGTIRFVHERWHSFTDTEFNRLRVHGTTQDITNRKTREQELLLLIARFQTLFDQASVGMARVSVEGNFLQINDKLCDVLRFPKEEWQSLSLAAFTSRADFDSDQELFQKLISGEVKSYEGERILRRFDNSEVWVFVSATAMKIDDQVVEIYLIIQDISSRKAAEDALRLSEQRLRLFVENATDSFFLTDADDEIVDCNALACQNLLCQREVIIGKSIKQFVKTSFSSLREMNEQLSQGGELKSWEIEICRCDGTTYPAELRLRVFQVDDRQFAFVIVQDITSRVKMETELHWKGIVVRNMFAGAVITSLTEDRVLYVSDQFEKTLGYGSGELTDKPASTIVVFDPCRLAQYCQEILQALLTVGRWQGDMLLHRKDGSCVWAKVSLTAFQHAQFGPVAIGVVEDITQRKQQENRIFDLQQSLAHANRFQTLGEIAFGLAHELNQPLAAIQLNAGAVRFIADRLDKNELVSCARHIEEQADRAGEIIKRIQSFIRREPTKRGLCKFDELLSEVVALLADYLRQNSIGIEFDLAQDAPPICVDRIQIQQVLVNLIRNSVDAIVENSSPEKKISIKTRLTEDAILVSVADSGPGIDREFAEKLFFPFHTSKPVGMGLGLSICRSLVDLHGGKIFFQANHPVGAVFTFSIPYE